MGGAFSIKNIWLFRHLFVYFDYNRLILFDAFSDVNRQQQHFFGEDPSQYVDEVKQSLAGERGLSPRNRDLVMEVLGRLADRVQSAENSRNAVVNELVSLRERFVVRIAPNVTTY